MSNDFKNYFWGRCSHTQRLYHVHYETPCTTSPLGFGLKRVLHKEAQQQLRKIFKFLLACFILETYPMQMFRDIKKKKLKMPKISVKLENLLLKQQDLAVSLLWVSSLPNLCIVRESPQHKAEVSTYLEAPHSAGAFIPVLEAMMFLQVQCHA